MRERNGVNVQALDLQRLKQNKDGDGIPEELELINIFKEFNERHRDVLMTWLNTRPTDDNKMCIQLSGFIIKMLNNVKNSEIWISAINEAFDTHRDLFTKALNTDVIKDKLRELESSTNIEKIRKRDCIKSIIAKLNSVQGSEFVGDLGESEKSIKRTAPQPDISKRQRTIAPQNMDAVEPLLPQRIQMHAVVSAGQASIAPSVVSTVNARPKKSKASNSKFSTANKAIPYINLPDDLKLIQSLTSNTTFEETHSLELIKFVENHAIDETIRAQALANIMNIMLYNHNSCLVWRSCLNTIAIQNSKILQMAFSIGQIDGNITTGTVLKALQECHINNRRRSKIITLQTAAVVIPELQEHFEVIKKKLEESYIQINSSQHAVIIKLKTLPAHVCFDTNAKLKMLEWLRDPNIDASTKTADLARIILQVSKNKKNSDIWKECISEMAYDDTLKKILLDALNHRIWNNEWTTKLNISDAFRTKLNVLTEALSYKQGFEEHVKAIKQKLAESSIQPHSSQDEAITKLKTLHVHMFFNANAKLKMLEWLRDPNIDASTKAVDLAHIILQISKNYRKSDIWEECVSEIASDDKLQKILLDALNDKIWSNGLENKLNISQSFTMKLKVLTKALSGKQGFAEHLEAIYKKLPESYIQPHSSQDEAITKLKTLHVHMFFNANAKLKMLEWLRDPNIDASTKAADLAQIILQISKNDRSPSIWRFCISEIASDDKLRQILLDALNHRIWNNELKNPLNISYAFRAKLKVLTEAISDKQGFEEHVKAIKQKLLGVREVPVASASFDRDAQQQRDQLLMPHNIATPQNTDKAEHLAPQQIPALIDADVQEIANNSEVDSSTGPIYHEESTNSTMKESDKSSHQSNCVTSNRQNVWGGDFFTDRMLPNALDILAQCASTAMTLEVDSNPAITNRMSFENAHVALLKAASVNHNRAYKNDLATHK